MTIVKKRDIESLIGTATAIADINRKSYEKEISDQKQKIGDLRKQNEELSYHLKLKDDVIRVGQGGMNKLLDRIEKLERRNAYLERRIKELEDK